VIGFEVNPYDICVANRTVYGKQQTLTWHVDHLKSSHVNPKVNDEFAEWCETTYGSDDLHWFEEKTGSGGENGKIAPYPVPLSRL
jgi:hypothetical protein